MAFGSVVTSDVAECVQNISKTSGEYRGIARMPVDICVRATVLRIKRLSPEAARHHQLEKTGFIEFDPRSPLSFFESAGPPAPRLAHAAPLALRCSAPLRSRLARSFLDLRSDIAREEKRDDFAPLHDECVHGANLLSPEVARYHQLENTRYQSSVPARFS
jgi:hypothetical protein